MPAKPLRSVDLALATVAMALSVRWAPVAAAAGPASLPLWALAMLGFMAPLVIATAEMTTRIPAEGGIYAWAREMLGPFAGFVCGWLYWVCNLPYFSGLLYFIVNIIGEIGGPQAQAVLRQPSVFVGLALAITAVVTGLHLVGLGTGKWIPNFGAAASLSLMLFIMLAGLAIAVRHGSATDFVHASYRPPLDANGAILWATLVFAFGGPEALAFLRGEVKGGTRQIVRVLAVVGAIMVAGYMLDTAAMLSILPASGASRLSGLPDALRVSLQRLGLGALTPVALALVAVSMLGGLSAWFGVAARLPFAAGVDQVLPRAFGRRDPRTGAPTAALIVQALVTAALVALSQAGADLKAAYDFLVAMTVLSFTLPFLFLFTAYLKIQSVPPPPDAWTPPGGPVAARLIGTVGLVVTLSAVLCTLVPSPDAADKTGAVVKLLLASGALVLSGIGFYAAAAWRRGRPGPRLRTEG